MELEAAINQLEDNFSEYREEVLQRLYEEATPGLDYQSLEQPRDGTPYHRLHFLKGDREQEIIDEVTEEYGFPQELSFELKKYFVLGGAPSTSKSTVNRAREAEGLKPVDHFLNGDDQQ